VIEMEPRYTARLMWYLLKQGGNMSKFQSMLLGIIILVIGAGMLIAGLEVPVVALSAIGAALLPIGAGLLGLQTQTGQRFLGLQKS